MVVGACSFVVGSSDAELRQKNWSFWDRNVNCRICCGFGILVWLHKVKRYPALPKPAAFSKQWTCR
uniref:Uncharacterized protein n=1 Tax=Arundo donax TaxID=35708 RepID=A0A0A9AVU7_ARUDO